MTVGVTDLVVAMLREEWRLHVSLFGGTRFATFPLTLLGLAALSTATLAMIGAPASVLAGGAVGLAFLFGLQTGSIGFNGRDELEDLLGGGTLLLYSARTLPLSRRRAVAAFLLKDALYYVALFVLPVTVGAVAGPAALTAVAPGVGAGIDLTVAAAVTLFGHAAIAGTLAFLLGLSLTLAATDLFARGARRATTAILLLAIFVILVSVLDLLPEGPVSTAALVPPYPAVWYGVAVLAIVVVAGAGVHRFQYPTGGSTRRRGDGYGRLRGAFDSVSGPDRSVSTGQTVEFDEQAVIGDDAEMTGRIRSPAQSPSSTPSLSPSGSSIRSSKRRAVATKTLLDVHRTSGGTWKLFVSSAILVLAAAAVLEAVQQWIVLEVSHALVFGVLLSATTFPTYNWVMNPDDPSEYHHYPIDAATLLSGKAVAFVVLGVPVAFVYYVAVVGLFAPPIAELLLGGVLLVGLSTYLLGVTALVTGFRPNEFLFDTPSFLAYSTLAMIAMIPALLFGFTGPVALTSTMGAGVVGFSAVATGIGLLAFRRSLGRWREELVLAP